MITSFSESVESAIKAFRPFSDKKPDLIKTGLAPVDAKIGGLYPGECGILAAATGVGKSSVMLEAVLTAGGVIISCEDGPGVLGGRILSHFSGVDSLKMRRGDLTKEDKGKIEKARAKVAGFDGAFVSYQVGAPLEEIEKAISQITKPTIVYLDYIQCISGVREDRRNEVSDIYRRFRTACSKNGCAGIAISQFRRLVTKETVPSIHHLKESGDLENEARLIILGHRDKKDDSVVRFRIAKSTFGGENVSFGYIRDSNGILSLLTPEKARARSSVVLPGWE